MDRKIERKKGKPVGDEITASTIIVCSVSGQPVALSDNCCWSNLKQQNPVPPHQTYLIWHFWSDNVSAFDNFTFSEYYEVIARYMLRQIHLSVTRVNNGDFFSGIMLSLRSVDASLGSRTYITF